MTSRGRIELCQDLDGALYAEFIRYSFATSDEAYFVVREEVQKGPNIAAVVKRLAPHLLAEQDVGEWPGTNSTAGLLPDYSSFQPQIPSWSCFWM